ncbi:hypothetical protein EGW08_004107 [Elysia chlorotica]|uniref:oleoyl-[acyl-carrier-protein] hydrolase n=1 Tax=Elysia chlorotica TaxID=188477 RepID=A0A3S1CBF0_ELYCH|nr:hypothetical protein EGW08_004107 [Elysia chlorotica]
MNCRFKKPYASVRLFCFPGAGAGTSFYTQWGRELSDNIEVHAVCLPGRDNRQKEPLCNTKKDTVDSIVESLQNGLLDKPFAFWGHSMGAILSFWVALELKRKCNKEPVHMFLSSAMPPNSTGFKNIVRFSMSDDEYFEHALNTFSDGLPKDITQNKDMMDVFLPIWKSDLSLLRKLSYEKNSDEEPPLSCLIDVFCGQGEDLDVINYLDEWNELTRETASKHFMPGDHFYLNEKANVKKIQSFIETKFEDID